MMVNVYDTCCMWKKQKKTKKELDSPVQCLSDKSSGKKIEWVEFIFLSLWVAFSNTHSQ